MHRKCSKRGARETEKSGGGGDPGSGSLLVKVFFIQKGGLRGCRPPVEEGKFG